MRKDGNFENLTSTLPDAFQVRFEILEQIGTGGTGTVYRGWDQTLQRSFALKVLNPDQTSSEKIAQLHREAKTLCQLKHPNIVSIYDFIVTTDEKPVMVMECVEGTSLDNLLDSRKSLSVHDSLDIVMQVCSAMEYAHARGILHRDLTPNNILLRKNDRDHYDIKVVDFGIAKIENIQDKTIAPLGSLVGSVTVISPQQARGEFIDARSDIYSLGCTMYKMLTGEFPYAGDSLIEIVNKHIYDPIPTLSDANEDEEFSDGLNQIVYKAMQKKPEDRFQSMREMKEAIERIFSPYVEGANEPQSALTRTGQLRTSHIVIGIAIVVISAIVATTYMLSFNPAEKLPEPAAEEEIATKRSNSVIWMSPTKSQLKLAVSLLRRRPDITRVNLRGVNFADDELSGLIDFPLTTLDLRQTSVTDNSLKILSRCKSLRALILNDCKGISDEGMKSIAKLPKLIILGINGTAIGDPGIASLTASNKSLRTIHISECPKITDESIPYVFRESKLDSLKIGGTQLTKVGVRKILNWCTNRGCIGINNLNLEDKDIPDVNNSYRLDISNNPKLTHVSLGKLRRWPNLIVLDLSGCPKIPTEDMEMFEGVGSDRHVVILPLEPSYVDIECSYEPKLYDTAGENQEHIKSIMKAWYLNLE